MVEAVYAVCALTSVACAVLLWRGWKRTAARLLLWAALGFAGFAVNNVVLLLDETVLSTFDLRHARHGSGFLGAAVLLGGLIWDSGAHR